MQDLSGQARFGPWVTSQAGGNMASSNERAMTAPGGDPVDPMPQPDNQGDPEVQVSDTRAVGTPASRFLAEYRAAPAIWRMTVNG